MHAAEGVTRACAQMCVLDGKQFYQLEEAGRQYIDDEVDTCVLTHNLQVRRMLALEQPSSCGQVAPG